MSKQTSPWVYVGCGCAGLSVLVVLAIAGLGMTVWRDLREFGETMQDPVARDARVREILGAETLPGNLRGKLYLRVPFMLELAVATDAGDGDDDSSLEVDRHLLSFLDIRDFGGRRARFRQAMESGKNPFEALDNTDVDLGVELDEVIDSGTLTGAGAPFPYLTARGRLSSESPRRRGMVALVEIRCREDDGRLRLLTWFSADDAASPEAAAGAEAEVPSAEAAPGARSEAPGDPGEPGDSGDIARLLAHLDPCGAE